ncbi:MAG: hypothetical protein V3T22_14615, partial [Planctomycetota bacterium]
AQQEEIRSALMERSAWHVEQIQALREQLDWLGDQASEHERRVAALTADKVKGRESIVVLEEERGWLCEGLADREALGKELESKLDASRSAVLSLDQETVWLRQTLEQEAGELSWLRERVSGSEEAPDGLSDREAIERHFASLEEELGALGKHEQWLTGEVMGLVRALHRRAEPGAPAADGPAGPALPEPGEVAGVIAEGHRALERVVKELAWRRDEMAQARRASETLFARLAGGGLAQRARTWSERAELDRGQPDRGQEVNA